MTATIEPGLDTFGDITAGADGRPRHPAAVIREVIEQRVLADSLGVDAFGVGGTPQSVIRAAHDGLPLMRAIIGGEPRRFAPLADLHRQARAKFGKPLQPIGLHSHGSVAATDLQAREELWPDDRAMRDRIGAERGWPPMSMADFERKARHGSLCLGSPETVARRIAETAKALGIQRFRMKYSTGMLPHPRLMRSIEPHATRVIPLVREMLG
jgi:alkanesulfonate monooxygenase SsuD/methylene tetrahydromethanopterin reductase-like flavin-dependent oxidoreductase (luciferase family)